MTCAVRRCFVTLVVLFLWRVGEVTEACSCAPLHPQQGFCNSDVVIRAKVTGNEEINVGNDTYGNPIKQIKYNIKQLKMYKGPDQDFDAFYTGPNSAICGVTLSVNDYLLTGQLETDGTLHVTLCDFTQLWDDLSDNQKKSLAHRYAMGCDCTITRCEFLPCVVSTEAECLWTDWLLHEGVNGPQAKNYACIKRRNGSCSWYRGAADPKTEFLNNEEP